MSESYMESPRLDTPGHKSIDDIITKDRPPSPYQFPNPMPPGIQGDVNPGSLNTENPTLKEYNADEALLWSNGGPN